MSGTLLQESYNIISGKLITTTTTTSTIIIIIIIIIIINLFYSKAKTSKSNCVRCLTLIDQGRNIVLKDTWDTIRRHNIDRKYHIECFCKYPCQGIESFKHIRWDDQKNDKTLIPVAEKIFNDFHRPNQAMPLRETPAAHIGLREQSNDLKREGYTGQQAIKKLENQIE